MYVNNIQTRIRNHGSIIEAAICLHGLSKNWNAKFHKMNGVYWMQNNRYVFLDFSFLNYCMHFFSLIYEVELAGLKKSGNFFFPISQKIGLEDP